MSLSKEKMNKRKKIDRENVKPKFLQEVPCNLHPVMEFIVDKVKREKFERICDSLGHHNVLGRVFYGCGVYSLGMDVVNDLLETTGRKK